ncbi:hypothetical protein KIPB_015606, partial [Kipferlia bialata]|eukprot:g15606.t1
MITPESLSFTHKCTRCSDMPVPPDEDTSMWICKEPPGSVKQEEEEEEEVVDPAQK